MKKLRSNDSGFSAVELILVIVIVALIGVVGYMVYKNHHKTTTPVVTTSPTKSATSTKTTTTTPPADPTAGWLTYTSSLGGFSFEYPASGWTLTAYDSGSGSWVTGSAVTTSESQLAVNENAGQGSSTSSLQYGININIGNQSDVNNDNGAVTYGLGSVISTLSNGIKLWQTTEDTFNTASVPKCGANGIVELAAVSSSNLYIQLPNSQYLNYTAGFCQGPGQTLTQTYQQQINDPETTVAKEVLSSIKY